MSRLPLRPRAVAWRRTHADPSVEVVPFETGLIAAALELYRVRDDKNWSLTDCLSFAVMNRRGLSEALTADRHFEQAGLKALMLGQPVF